MLGNLILEMCNAPGTAADCDLLGATSGRLPFGFWFATGAQCFYVMTDGTQEEWGIGTYTAGSPNKLNRTTVIKNSANSTARLNFLGTTKIYNETPAERSLWIDNTGNLNIAGTIAAQSMTVSNAVGPLLSLRHTAAALDAKSWEIVSQSGNFYGRAANDTNNAWTNWLTVTRSGMTITGITLAGTAITLAGAVATNALSVTGALSATGDVVAAGIGQAQYFKAQQGAGYPQYQFVNTAGPGDQKRSVLFQDPSGNISFQFNRDDDLAATQFFGATRSGYAPASITLTAPIITFNGEARAANTFKINQGGAYFHQDAANSVTQIVMDSAAWRLQYARVNGALTWVRGSDSATLFQVDGVGNGYVPGSFRASGNFMADGGRYQVANNANYWLGRDSDGYWKIVDNGGVKFTMDASGNTTVAGYMHAPPGNDSIGCSNAFSYLTINGSNSFTGGANIRLSGAGDPFGDGSIVEFFWSTTRRAQIDQGGNIWITASGFSPGGGPWIATSDARVKTVTGDYGHGLAEVLRLNPVTYRYRGNLNSGPASASRLHTDTDKEYVGLVAQDVQSVMPETIKRSTGFIDGARVDDLLSLDLTALPMALVNAVKTLHEKLSEANNRIASLERRAAA
jgi:hypothetical protein